MGSSRVVLARECFANLALNLLIESESVCFFCFFSPSPPPLRRGEQSNKPREGVQQRRGCALIKFTFPLVRAGRVLQCVNLAQLL